MMVPKVSEPASAFARALRREATTTGARGRDAATVRILN
jgi:hypothetical protein